MAVIIMLATGCSTFRVITRSFEKPDLTFSGCELGEATRQQVALKCTLQVHNPNPEGVKNIMLSYALCAEGIQFLQGNDVQLHLLPNSVTDVELPAVIHYADLVPVVRNIMDRMLSGEKTLPILIKAHVSGKPAIIDEGYREQRIPIEVDVTKTVEVPLPGMMRMRNIPMLQ